MQCAQSKAQSWKRYVQAIENMQFLVWYLSHFRSSHGRDPFVAGLFQFPVMALNYFNSFYWLYSHCLKFHVFLCLLAYNDISLPLCLLEVCAFPGACLAVK